MIKSGDFGFVAEEFNGYLDSIKKPECFAADGEDYRPSYICQPEPLTEEEAEKWPGCQVVCFRVVGYTIGHLIIEGLHPANFTIKEVIVYDREGANVFKVSCKELERLLKEKFVGQILA